MFLMSFILLICGNLVCVFGVLRFVLLEYRELYQENLRQPPVMDLEVGPIHS